MNLNREEFLMLLDATSMFREMSADEGDEAIFSHKKWQKLETKVRKEFKENFFPRVDELYTCTFPFKSRAGFGFSKDETCKIENITDVYGNESIIFISLQSSTKMCAIDEFYSFFNEFKKNETRN